MSEAEAQAKIKFLEKFNSDYEFGKYQNSRPLTPYEFKNLENSISESSDAEGETKLNIVIDEEGEILDGHHRVYIAGKLGLQLDESDLNVLFGLSEAEKHKRSIKLNAARRHLSSDEVKELVGDAFAKNPTASVRVIAEQLRLPKSTVHDNRSTVRPGQSSIGKDGRSYSIKKKPKAKSKLNLYQPFVDFCLEHQLNYNSAGEFLENQYTQGWFLGKLEAKAKEYGEHQTEQQQYALEEELGNLVKEFRQNRENRKPKTVGREVKDRYGNVSYHFNIILDREDASLLKIYCDQNDEQFDKLPPSEHIVHILHKSLSEMGWQIP